MGHFRGPPNLRILASVDPQDDTASLLTYDTPTFWYMVAAALALVLFAGLMSGLTLGLLSIEKLDLRVIEKSGDEVSRQRASKVHTLLHNEHLLLVTLLVFNATAMETLPLVLQTICPPAVVILISVTAVLIFGEIVPQAVCKTFGLAVGSASAPIVRFLMLVGMPITWPIAKVLDQLLGHDGGRTYERLQMAAVLQIHREDGYITQDEETVMHGALEMASKTCAICTTPMDRVGSLPVDGKLDEATMNWMLKTGHSRIPIHAAGNRGMLLGVLIVKRLLGQRPEDDTPIASLELAPIMRVHVDTELYKVLDMFQTGSSHMAAVYPAGMGLGEQLGSSVSADACALGIVTLEDVIEELLKEEIVDETDQLVHAEDPNSLRAEYWRSRSNPSLYLSALFGRSRPELMRGSPHHSLKTGVIQL